MRTSRRGTYHAEITDLLGDSMGVGLHHVPPVRTLSAAEVGSALGRAVARPMARLVVQIVRPVLEIRSVWSVACGGPDRKHIRLAGSDV